MQGSSCVGNMRAWTKDVLACNLVHTFQMAQNHPQWSEKCSLGGCENILLFIVWNRFMGKETVTKNVRKYSSGGRDDQLICFRTSIEVASSIFPEDTLWLRKVSSSSHFCLYHPLPADSGLHQIGLGWNKETGQIIDVIYVLNLRIDWLPL